MEKEEIISAIDALRDELTSISQYIHANPELGLQEYKASSALCDCLEKHGFRVERGLCGMPTAFRATCSGASEGRKVAILAEYDALEGLGHGCGHNLIAAIALGASLGLSKVLPKMAGTVVTFGTPAEEPNVEGAGGKAPMAAAGCFDDCAAALMVHPGVRTGAGGGSSLGATSLEIKFYGKPTHASAIPHLGVNALNALIETFNAINALRQHITPDARIHGIITHGGSAPNVVPELAIGRFIIRAEEMSYLEELVGKVKRCAEGAAIVTGAKVEFGSFFHTFEPTLPNYTLAEVFRANYRALGLEVVEPQPQQTGRASTDFGNVSQRIPAAGAGIAIAPLGTAGHSHEMAAAAASPRADEALMEAAKAMALTAYDVLTDDELMARARQEFEDKKAAKGQLS
jgi:amidohydrolase